MSYNEKTFEEKIKEIKLRKKIPIVLIAIIAIFIIIDNPIFLFFIIINKIMHIVDRKIGPPKFVINFAIGVAKSVIKNIDINVYPITSHFIIS